MELLTNTIAVTVSTVTTVAVFLMFCGCLGLVALLAAGRDDKDNHP